MCDRYDFTGFNKQVSVTRRAASIRECPDHQGGAIGVGTETEEIDPPGEAHCQIQCASPNTMMSINAAFLR